MAQTFKTTPLILLAFFCCQMQVTIAANPRYDGSWRSLQTMPVPAWFDDGKIGIFIHWGPYSAIGYRKSNGGYAEHVPKLLYDDSAHYYPYMKKRWGATPPEFGYKDIIPEFKAEKWDPDEWAEELSVEIGVLPPSNPVENQEGGIEEMNAAIKQLTRHKSLVGLFAGVVAIAGLLSDVLCAESEFVEQFKFSGGIVVAIDFDDGQSIADLATDEPFVVHALLRDEARVAAARQVIQKVGIYGKVSCELYNGSDLPYVDGLVNLVLCKESCEVPQAELMRVLVPGGRLVVEGPSGWTKRAKPVPDGLDEWNQFLHGADNNGVSLDDVGGA